MRRKSTLRTRLAETPRLPFLDDEEDRAPDSSHAIDPLDAEPLTADEIERLEEHDPDIEEDSELAIHVLQSGTEAKMPIDGEAAEVLEEPADKTLDVWRRPRAKSHP